MIERYEGRAAAQTTLNGDDLSPGTLGGIIAENHQSANDLIWAGCQASARAVKVLLAALLMALCPPLAAECERNVIDKMLIGEGRGAEVADEEVGTALGGAARYGHTKIVKALIEAGADVNAVNGCGETALHWAAYGGHTEVARVLIEGGADVNVNGWRGVTALMWAARYGHAEIVKMLVEAGAKFKKGPSDDRRSRG